MNSRRILDFIAKIGIVIILLEPVWMLLPFAGFLYGSILNLEFLQSYHFTVWLLYFIFPVQTFFPLAWALILIGCTLFLIGAFQIYMAKFRKSGMVKKGVYKKFRHPQYTGLAIFCIGSGFLSFRAGPIVFEIMFMFSPTSIIVTPLCLPRLKVSWNMSSLTRTNKNLPIR